MTTRPHAQKGIDRRTFLKAGATVAVAAPFLGLSSRASAADFNYKPRDRPGPQAIRSTSARSKR